MGAGRLESQPREEGRVAGPRDRAVRAGKNG